MLCLFVILQKSTPQDSYVITLALYQQVTAQTKEFSDEVSSTYYRFILKLSSITNRL